MNKQLSNLFVISETAAIYLPKSSINKTRGVFLVLAFLSIALFTLSGCATQSQLAVPPLMVSGIVKQSQAGVPDNDIIRQIAESGTVYRLSASELANLRDKGVSNAVINYMQQTYLDAIRRDQSVADRGLWIYGPDGYYYGGYPFGWPYYYVPYVPEHDRLHKHAQSTVPKASPKHPHS